MVRDDKTVAGWADDAAVTALRRVEQADRDFAAPYVDEALVDGLERVGAMVGTLRWSATIPDRPGPLGEEGLMPSGAEVASMTLGMPSVLEALRGLVDQALMDCEAAGLHPVGLNLRTSVRGRWVSDRFARSGAETFVTVSARVVDSKRLLELRGD